jgi:dihydrofolate reductase
MRRVIESTLVSLDGVIGDPQLWANEYFDEEAERSALEQLLVSDAMLMGRNTYEMFAAAWPNASGDYPDRMNAIPKYVFSNTLAEVNWTNATIVRGDPPRPCVS